MIPLRGLMILLFGKHLSLSKPTSSNTFTHTYTNTPAHHLAVCRVDVKLWFLGRTRNLLISLGCTCNLYKVTLTYLPSITLQMPVSCPETIFRFPRWPPSKPSFDPSQKIRIIQLFYWYDNPLSTPMFAFTLGSITLLYAWVNWLGSRLSEKF